MKLFHVMMFLTGASLVIGRSLLAAVCALMLLYESRRPVLVDRVCSVATYGGISLHLLLHTFYDMFAHIVHILYTETRQTVRLIAY